jgi:hypothetical protein
MNLSPSPRSYNFVKALEFTLPWEAGLERDGSLRRDGGLHYRDGGLATKYGIWQGANPDLDVANLTLDQSIEVYKERYWLIYLTQKPVYANLDSVEIGSAVSLFDAGVNCGVSRAWGWFRKGLDKKVDPALEVLSQRQAHYNRLKSDPEHAKNYNGWMRRLNDLKKYVEILRTA